MTIDEAIKRIKEKMACDYNISGCDTCNISSCEDRDIVIQLAEWLEELKDYRGKNKIVVRIDCINSEEFKDIAVKLAKEQYNKSIDDIKEKLMKNGFIYTQHALDVFNEIAEQLKAGDGE